MSLTIPDAIRNLELAIEDVDLVFAVDAANKNLILRHGSEFDPAATASDISISSQSSTYTDIMTEASGVTISSFRYKLWGKILQVYFRWTYNSDITVNSNGTIAGGNFAIATLKHGYYPYTYVMSCSDGLNAGKSFYITYYTDGNIYFTSMDAIGSPYTVTAGTYQRFSATYILA